MAMNRTLDSEAFLRDAPANLNDPDYVTFPLLTVGQAAAHLGVARRVIYQLIEMGEIRTVRVSGSAMVEKRTLDDFRASGKLT